MLGKFDRHVADQSNSPASQAFALLSSTCYPPPLHIRHPHLRLYVTQNCHNFEILNSKVKFIEPHPLITSVTSHILHLLLCPLTSLFGLNSSAHSYLLSFFFMTNLSIISNTISPNPLTPILSVNLSHTPGKTSGLDQSSCLFIPHPCLD